MIVSGSDGSWLTRLDWLVIELAKARLARGPLDHGSTGSWSNGPRLDWLVVQWTTARLARGPVDHGSTGSWSSGPRLDWLVVQWTIQSDCPLEKPIIGILKRLWRALKSLQTVVRNRKSDKRLKARMYNKTLIHDQVMWDSPMFHNTVYR